MEADAQELAGLIRDTIGHLVTEADTASRYRLPVVGFVSADEPRFSELRRVAGAGHLLPQDLLPDARSVVSFFLPFAPWVVKANSQHREQVAREWAEAYVKTNALIGYINTRLAGILAEKGICTAAEPATHNFDPVSLASHWSHKSVAVIAGLGSFGLHQMVITDSGCAGRFGSLVLNADLPVSPAPPRQRCLYFHDGSCLECVTHCPANALDANSPLDKQRCYRHLLDVAQQYTELGLVDVCGKCAIGPCSFESAVL